ncbi:F-box domain-containing protein [Histoplasma ohiense]|nr:F-box domain-containing protein [Histoplasma ohiense (nom. inval.)]
MTKILLGTLATELLLHIFHSCSAVADVLNLSLTCRRLHDVFSASQKLPILANAVEAEFGPLEDIIQLVTQNTSQPTHVSREAPISLALIQQAVEVGRVAKKWEVIYPIKKWKVDFENRRVLDIHECFVLRRAAYRLWLYSRAFHCQLFPRTSRTLPSVVRERAELLHNWPTSELAEIEDFRLVMREVVQSQICPSNETIQRKFKKRFPENTPTTTHIHLNYRSLTPPPLFPLLNFHAKPAPTLSSIDRNNCHFHALPTSRDNSINSNNIVTSTVNKYATKFRSDLYHEPGMEGWGDQIHHYYVVEDMMKLDPSQVIWLRENAPLKEQVESYVRSMGDWFDNNGETFGQTLEWVMGERGRDYMELHFSIVDGEAGIAKLKS